MAQLVFLYEQGGELSLLKFDALLTEQHSATATVTEHPIERGANIIDHVRPERRHLTIEAFVTNTPIESPDVDGARGSVRVTELSPSQRTFDKLANRKKASTTQFTKAVTKANVLQFDASFNRVVSVHATLSRLCREGTIVTVISPLTRYTQMCIQEISSPRDAASRNASTFTISLIEIETANSQTVDEPLPLEPRGQRSSNRGAAPVTEVPEVEVLDPVRSESILHGGFN